VAELPLVLEAADPALANLNAAFPPLRAFAREALPGVESAPETLRAATPLLEQIRLLSRPSELRGLANDLVPAVPALASLSEKTPDFLEQARPLASCFNNVIIPWSLDEVQPTDSYPLPVVGPVYKETAYGLTGLAGESRSQDANGQYIRVAAGGGSNTVSTIADGGEQLAGVAPLPVQGAMPAPDSSSRTPFRPDVPCENQDPPDLGALEGPGPTNSPTPPFPRSDTGASDSADEILAAQDEIMGQLEGLATAVEADDGLKGAERATEKLVRKYYEDFGN
jgi:hypothetical protein